ncbi:hypothetical protein RclHR1_00640028 [Rhizophagus clarus]|uniref:Uncharacterized protein n=1 Tax=Rhizophagus clarus TaxID=94130 RepID=A0A2Z6S8L7_9GLOM|nr:hypothetical protein RclHR1_00640028 [Rhizophagus clarus]GES99147.1 hypothetical protein GLOIN_2v1549299 [Rhizophagus clarus]
MGTHSIILLRERSTKRKETSFLGGPDESKYSYEYYVCIYQQYDGYVEGGVGEWLADFLQKFTQDLSTLTTFADAGLLGAKLIKAFYSSPFSNPRLEPIAPLEDIFQIDYDYVYIITVTYSSRHGMDDKSIMLSVCHYKDFILTARPEKLLEKYKYYVTQMEENKKSFAEISYDDEEVEKNGYLSEDQLLLEFIKKTAFD